MFEDSKGVIRSRHSKKNRQSNDHKKEDKKTTMVYKTLHRTLKMDHHELY